MLDPDLIAAAVVSSFQSIPAVVQQLGGLTDTDNLPTIYVHEYLIGEENSLSRSVWSMRNPSVLVAYTAALWGNFMGDQLWKHQLEVYYRPKNSASGQVAPGVPACSAPHLWWLMMHDPVQSPSPGDGLHNIRQIRLLPSLLLIERPTWKYVADQPGGDLFCGSITIPELGDD